MLVFYYALHRIRLAKLLLLRLVGTFDRDRRILFGRKQPEEVMLLGELLQLSFNSDVEFLL